MVKDPSLYHSIALTGHRPPKLGGYNPSNPVASAVLATAEDWLGEERETHPNLAVISGLALGWDQWVADLCGRLGIPYAGAAPCRGQSDRWPDRSKDEYQRICRGTDPDFAAWLNTGADGEVLPRRHGVLYVHDGPYPGPSCLQDRNVWMVDHAVEVLACFDGSSGGTANCVKYARKESVPIHVIDTEGTLTRPMVQDSLW